MTPPDDQEPRNGPADVAGPANQAGGGGVRVMPSGDPPSLRRAVIFCAAVGGIAPFLVNAAKHFDADAARAGILWYLKLLTDGTWPEILSASIAPIIPSFAAAAAAIFLVWLYQEANHSRAFLFGMGAPSLFVSLVLNAGNTGTGGAIVKDIGVETSGIEATRLIALLSEAVVRPALAQDGTVSPAEATDERILKFDLGSLKGDCADCTITFKGADGASLEMQRLNDATEMSGDVVSAEVPDGAATAVIGGVSSTNSAEFNVDQAIEALQSVSKNSLSSSDGGVIELSRESNWLNGVKLGTGVIGVKPYDLELKAKQLSE